MFKIGFIGNSCTGKTTAAFTVIRSLKYKKLLVGYCTDACRFVTFPPARFDVCPDARLNVLFKQLSNETEQMVREDVDYLVTERTAIDWWLYYVWTCKQVAKDPAVEIAALVKLWLRSYDLLFFLDSKGMSYVDDGFRPASTKIRDEIDSHYCEWLARYEKTCRDLRIVTDGSVEKRVETVERLLEDWLKGHWVTRPSRELLYVDTDQAVHV